MVEQARKAKESLKIWEEIPKEDAQEDDLRVEDFSSEDSDYLQR